MGRVCAVLDACCTETEADSIEFRIVQDADTLAGLAAEGSGTAPDTLETALSDQLKTEAAKEKARTLFRA